MGSLLHLHLHLSTAIVPEALIVKVVFVKPLLTRDG